jgi:hypothetical protein
VSAQFKILVVAGFLGVAFLIWATRGVDIEQLSPDLVVGDSQEASRDQAIPIVDNAPNQLEQSAIDRGSNLVEEFGDTVPQGPRKLYSEANAFDPGYKEANDQADEILNDLEYWSRNMIVKTDLAATQELMRQVELRTSNTLDSSFDLSPYSDVPCIVSTIDFISPRFVPGTEDVPNRYQIEARCEFSSSRTKARISVIKDEGKFSIAIRSPIWGAFSVARLVDSEYSLAYRDDYASSDG